MMFETLGPSDPRASPSFDIPARDISRDSRFSVSSVSTTSSGLSSMTGRSESVSSPGWVSDGSSPSSEQIIHDSVENGEIPPKVEELDEDVDMSHLLPLDLPEDTSSTTVTVVKRGRGRPRKHPIVPKSDHKGKSGRSKTGCITCRRRKKKCDEGKPECQNCLKNGVVCQGYQVKSLWQPGQKNPQLRLASQFVPPTYTINMQLPSLIDGIESPIDKLFLDHYHAKVSRILTVWEDDHNPFQEVLIPLAIRDKALMHALLALSGTHLLQSAEQPTEYEAAKSDHLNHALSALRKGLARRNNNAEKSDAATVLVLLLDNICSGETTGTYRVHLDAARSMLSDHQHMEPDHQDIPIMRFLYEFFTYHDIIGLITSLDRPVPPALSLPGRIMEPDAAALMGVLDGLFTHVSEITLIRNEMRARFNRGILEADYTVYLRALNIERAIQDWKPNHPEGSERHTAALLYRQCAWIYLYRTLEIGRSEKIRIGVNQGLQYLRAIPEQSGTQSILLMPLFLLACSAFDEDQRPAIRQRFDSLQEWSGLGNIKLAFLVVQEIWKLMDAGDDARSWDWEKVISGMGIDFLVT